MDKASLQQKALEEPFKEENHDKLIAFLRLDKAGNWSDLFAARIAKNECFMLTSLEVNQVVEDLYSIPNDADRNVKLKEFYETILVDHPTVQHWKHYLEFYQSTYPNDNKYEQLLGTSLQQTSGDFANSPAIWNKSIEFYISTGNIEKAWELHLQRLATPHLSLSQSYEQTSQFVSQYKEPSYAESMIRAERIYKKTERQQRYYDQYESQLASDPNVWLEYIAQVAKYGDADALFYRAIDSVDDVVPVYLAYIHSLHSNPEKFIRVAKQFVRQIPQKAISYTQIFRATLEEIELEPYRTRIAVCGILARDDWKDLALAMLARDHISDSKHLDLDINMLFKRALKEDDATHAVEKLCISILESRARLEDALDLVRQLAAKFTTQADVHIYAHQFFKYNGVEGRVIISALQKALQGPLDSPEKVILEKLNYEFTHSLLPEQLSLIQEAETLLKEVEENPSEAVDSRKRKLEESIEPQKKVKVESREDRPTRSREDRKVKVSNLSQNVTEKMIQAFFHDCGEIRDIIIYLTKTGVEAAVEFADHQHILAALTKTYKQLGDNKVTVERMVNSIIWVTNFPPSIDEAKLRTVFSTAGTIISIRFPRQTSNKQRRFCYIEYSSSELAEYAVGTLNGNAMVDELDGKSYRIVVKVSDQQIKRAPIFNREVYISNLDFKIPEDKVRAFFDECGSIESIVLPLNYEMKKKKNKNGGFGFVVFNSEVSAREALKLNGTKFHGRPINVLPSKKTPKTSIKDEINSINEDLSVVLLGVDPTLTKQQLELFLREKLDIDIEGITHVPDHESAIIQFKTVADAGKASMRLQNESFKGNPIEIGSKKDLLAKVNPPSRSKVTMFVPASLQSK